MEQIKRSWYIAKFYRNAAVADHLANYTLLDYRFELIGGLYMFNLLTKNKFLKGNKIKTTQSWNIVTMNMLKVKMK